MPEPQLLSLQPLPLLSFPTPSPRFPGPSSNLGLSVWTAACGGEGSGRHELRKEPEICSKKWGWGL